MGAREYFINGVIWTIAAVLILWGLSAGVISRLDAALIAAAVAWPFAVFYSFRVEGLFGWLLKLYAFAPPVALAGRYFKFF